MNSFSRLNPFQPFLQNPHLRAIGLVFLIHSLPLSTWILYIPIMKDKLQLSESQLGIALFCFAAGAFTIMPLSGRLIRLWGDGKVTFYSTLLLCTLYIFPLLSPTYLLLCISLYTTGLMAGLMDIAMNAVASIQEKNTQQYIMSGCHGFFSLGAMLGSGIGSFFISPSLHPALHMATLNLFLILLTWALKPHFIAVVDTPAPTQTKKWVLLPLLGLAFMCFAFMMGEGSIHDWSGIFMREEKGATLTFMGLGFAAFNATMALGRFFGDRVQSRYSPLQIVFMGGAIALMGLATILMGNWWVAIMGFACIGLGFSGMIPTLFRAAANIQGIPAAQGIATMAGVGYIGFLLGPVILGFIAEYYSLMATFSFILGLVVLTLCMAPRSFRNSH